MLENDEINNAVSGTQFIINSATSDEFQNPLKKTTQPNPFP